MDDPSFLHDWYAARFNQFWFLTFIVPLLLAFISLVLRRTWLIAVLVILSLILTYDMSVSAVRRKWDLRMQAAKTEKQRGAVAGSDNANLAFSVVIFGPLEAIFYTAGAFVLVHAVSAKYHRNNKAIADLLSRSAAEAQCVDAGSKLTQRA